MQNWALCDKKKIKISLPLTRAELFQGSKIRKKRHSVVLAARARVDLMQNLSEWAANREGKITGALSFSGVRVLAALVSPQVKSTFFSRECLPWKINPRVFGCLRVEKLSIFFSLLFFPISPRVVDTLKAELIDSEVPRHQCPHASD